MQKTFSGQLSASFTLFSIYINDLVTHFDESCDPVKLMERNVSCLLYADDLVLISESAIGLQNSVI
jgi:hypothetical protein